MAVGCVVDSAQPAAPSADRPPLHTPHCARFFTTHPLSDMYPLCHDLFPFLCLCFFFSFLVSLFFFFLFSPLSHIGRRSLFIGLCAVFRVPPHFLKSFPTSRPSAVRLGRSSLPAARSFSHSKKSNTKKNHPTKLNIILGAPLLSHKESASNCPI